jgi:hypothetical protein
MEKAELFAAHLSKVFTPNENHPDQEIEEDITTLPQNILQIKLLSPKEIKEEIGFLNIKNTWYRQNHRQNNERAA